MAKTITLSPAMAQDLADFFQEEQTRQRRNMAAQLPLDKISEAWLRLLRGEEIQKVSQSCGIPEERLAPWRDKVRSQI